MYKSYSMELAGRTLTVDIGRVCAQANGAALLKYGETTVLSTATASEKPRDGIDFFPLSVEYEEKMYSVGKIPGGFNKREGKASENAILTSRVIDRPMRPLFPKDYRNDVTLNNMVMSVDPECRPEIVAMIGAALATTISDIPFDGPCAMTQMGLVDGEFVVNPSQKDWNEGDLQLTVASTREKVIMIEAGANEVPEAKMIEAIYKCHDINQTIIAFIDKITAEVGKAKHEYTSCAIPEEMFAAMKEIVTPEQMEEAVFTDEKQVREENIRQITEKLEEAFAENEEWLAVLGEAVYQYQKKTVRKMILKDHKRPDGRAINQIRPLAAEVDLIPRVHGSAMFTRGQTQTCDVVTLAPLSEVQKIDGLDANITTKRYLHQYNFPAYSVGETKVSRGPGRREIGHGALAEKALVPVLPSVEEFPYAIRAVSETFESNGSTSMASTCASCMSLMAAGVPIKKMVAGISCGLVTGDTDDDYVVLTDIQGLEDFFGDMDFKVTGTHDGITAIQMDIKIHGLTRPIVEEAIARTREARLYIMDEVMSKAISEPRKEVNEWAPKIEQIQIDPSKIGDVVGQKGKTINEIIARTEVKIDITDDGSVSVCGTDKDKIQKAIDMIKIITTDFAEGQILTGTVVSIKEFGAFIEFAPGKEGMVHISKIAKERINHVEDVLTLGDKVTVVCLGKDKMGRISFSMKDVPENK
ncbi:MAG: polyribonucleotide nucleotidyltransferase [Roseburia sp.]|nr:polyribonucleotide nucleotidyltransferase [Roseburia sp.]